MRQLIIFSDCTDIAFSEVYHTLQNGLDQASITDINIAPLVSIKNFSTLQAAFSIRLLAEICCPGTLFLVIVNGNKRSPDRIFGETNNGIVFVGSNSGYFNWMIEDCGLKQLYRNKIDRSINGKSFGGKYVQAPTAIKILSNVGFETLGERIEESFLADYEIKEGTIVHCDNFGLIKIKAPLPQLEEGEELKISINGRPAFDAIYSEKMKKQADGTWVLFPGSSLNGLPELGRVRSLNSAQEINVTEGDVITWERVLCDMKT